jgi:hypothetical protein
MSDQVTYVNVATNYGISKLFILITENLALKIYVITA